ncbi:TPA: hypothetical protein DDZ86_03100 [Candidatus Dependentiae bacterium]|nr:hypothetical protein [Candidatus Dependentiae bacterium]
MRKPRTYLPIVLCALALTLPTNTTTKSLWNSISTFFTPDEKKSRSESIPFTTGTITIKNQTGRIEVKSWNKPEILLETVIKGSQEKIECTHVTHKKSGNQLTIETKTLCAEAALPVTYYITVPTKASLVIEQEQGPLLINDVGGALTLQTDSGSIEVENAQDSVIAKAPRGHISVDTAQLLPSMSLFLESGSGINLTLPAHPNAEISAQSANGFVNIDFDVTLKAKTVKINKKEWNLQRRCIEGTIGRGGASIVLSTIDRAINVSER